jgi:hypothetical protein
MLSSLRYALPLWLLLSSSAANSSQLPNAQVFVLAIGEHVEGVYNRLDAVDERVKEIRSYFERTYDLEDEQFHIATGIDDTSEAAIKGQFFDELDAVDEHSIVFFFLLSHGVKTTGSRFVAEDLIVIASDTPEITEEQTYGRITGEEILRAISKVGENSVVFAFFDTCNSGAIAQISNRFEAALDFKLIRVFALASSGAEQTSYNFEFTHNVLTQLEVQRDDCVYADPFRDILRGVSRENQIPELIVRFDDLCINGISPGKGVMFLNNYRGAEVQLNYLVEGYEDGVPTVLRRDATNQPVMRDRAAYLIQTYVNGSLRGEPYSLDLQSLPLQLLDITPYGIMRSGSTNPYGDNIRSTGGTTGAKSPILRN